MDDLDLQVFTQEPSLSSNYPHEEGPPILDTLLKNTLTISFQGIFLEVKQGNPWHQRQPCHPSILPGTINVLQVPHEGPHILDKIIIKISTQNFQGIFLGVKQGHPWCHGWPWPSSLLSGTIIFLQVPPLKKEGSWHTSNWARDLTFGMHDWSYIH